MPGDHSTAAVVIGGSALRAPPRFMEGCYRGITKSYAFGFSFRVIPGNDWKPEGLVVPLFHHLGTANDIAEFSIWSDVAGEPGEKLAAFLVSGITASHSLCFGNASSIVSPLKGGATYWLIGSSPTGQVNWMCDRDVYNGTEAHRNDNADWVVRDGGNVDAFAIYGSAVTPPLAARPKP